MFWVLFIVPQAKVVPLKQLLNFFQRLAQTIQKYIFWVTLILIYFRSKNVYSIKRILNQCHMMLKTIFKFCSLYGLKQQIKSPTRVTCSASSLIDHILTLFQTERERVSQQGIIDVGLSNHQLIYCARKFSCTKAGTHKQITFRSVKNYAAEAYKESLGKVYFPNYENLTWIKLMKTSFKN